MASGLIETTSRRLFVKDHTTNLHFLVDTGADISVLPYKTNLMSVPKDSCNLRLSAANGTVIETFGTTLLELNLGLRRSFKHTFLLAAVGKPILGADFLSKFDLMVDLKNKKLIDRSTNIEINANTIMIDVPNISL